MITNVKFLRTIIGTFLITCLLVAAPGLGRVKISNIKNYTGGDQLPKPASIVVYDFAITPEEISLNKAVLQRIKAKMSGSASEEDAKTKLARKIVESFSSSLVKHLEKSGLTVKRGSAGEPQPDNALAVQGDFERVDEGNRTRRMVVGLGAGASEVTGHVECFVKKAEANVMLTEFEASSKSSRKPGAAETAGVSGAASAGAAVAGVSELTQSAQADADRMAKGIAKQIMKAMTAQGWLKPAPGTETKAASEMNKGG